MGPLSVSPIGGPISGSPLYTPILFTAKTKNVWSSKILKNTLISVHLTHNLKGYSN